MVSYRRAYHLTYLNILIVARIEYEIVYAKLASIRYRRTKIRYQTLQLWKDSKFYNITANYLLTWQLKVKYFTTTKKFMFCSKWIFSRLENYFALPGSWDLQLQKLQKCNKQVVKCYPQCKLNSIFTKIENFDPLTEGQLSKRQLITSLLAMIKQFNRKCFYIRRITHYVPVEWNFTLYNVICLQKSVFQLSA